MSCLCPCLSASGDQGVIHWPPCSSRPPRQTGPYTRSSMKPAKATGKFGDMSTRLCWSPLSRRQILQSGALKVPGLWGRGSPASRRIPQLGAMSGCCLGGGSTAPLSSAAKGLHPEEEVRIPVSADPFSTRAASSSPGVCAVLRKLRNPQRLS